MNLKQFLDYRSDCPCCNNKLVTYFHSQKQQTVKYEDNRLVAIFRLDTLKKGHINYKTGYSFDLQSNSWQAEFYNQDEKRFEVDSPEHLKIRFKELTKNLGKFAWIKSCTTCNSYNYQSNYFLLDYKSGKMSEDLMIGIEYIGMTSPFGDGFKIYKLLNNYKTSQSTLCFGKFPTETIARADWGMYNPPIDELDLIQTSLIKFSSKEETMDRISKLIIFS